MFERSFVRGLPLGFLKFERSTTEYVRRYIGSVIKRRDIPAVDMEVTETDIPEVIKVTQGKDSKMMNL